MRKNAYPPISMVAYACIECCERKNSVADSPSAGPILDQSIVLAFIRNSFRGLARPIPRPGAFYNLIELDRGGDSDSADFFPLGN